MFGFMMFFGEISWLFLGGNSWVRACDEALKRGFRVGSFANGWCWLGLRKPAAKAGGWAT